MSLHIHDRIRMEWRLKFIDQEERPRMFVCIQSTKWVN